MPSPHEPTPALGVPPGLCHADEVRWFEQKVHPHAPHLRVYLQKAFPTVCDVDDVLQESLLRIWKAKAARTVESTKAFMFRVARNVAIDIIRRERSGPIDRAVDLADVCAFDVQPSAAEAVCSREEMDLLADALASLPERCRQVVVMRKIHRRPQREIASELGITEAMVQNHVVRGVRRCEDYLRTRGVSAPLRNSLGS